MRRAFVTLLAAAVPWPGPAQPPLLPGFRLLFTGPGGGRVWTGVFPDAAAPQPLRAGYVYLPPGFSAARRYPVVYLLHGLRGSPSEYVYSLHLAGVGDSMAATPFIAVVPAAGPDSKWNGEWAGPWEDYLVSAVIPWVDARLPTIRGPAGRILAGLSAGGFGAVDIGLRHPGLFSRIESWGGYFQPLMDGPLKQADEATLEANDPALLLRRVAPELRRDGVRFFLSSGPAHGRTKPAATIAFARELGSYRIPHDFELLAFRDGMWQQQLADGLRWALGA